MHIPDNFLSPPVWLALDAISLPLVGWVARRSFRDSDHTATPRLGVMGAFVFAAQMINFPVGAGTSAHLLGGALLVSILGPTATVLVMTTIVAMQAFVFQDGGVLALGANVFNMALAGVVAAALALRAFRRFPSAALFLAGAVSVLASAFLALAELLASGVHMPPALLWASIGLFAVSAVVEGAITLAVVRAVSRLNSRWLSLPSQAGRGPLAAFSLAALLMAVAAFFVASSQPDGLQTLAARFHISSQPILPAPLAGYSMSLAGPPWLGRASAALAGLLLAAAACLALGRFLARRRSA